MSLLDDVSIVVTPNGYKAGELYAVMPTPIEGSEEVDNGTFLTNTTTGWNDWDNLTNPNNTSQQDGYGILDATTGTCDARQEPTVTPGKTYLIEATLKEDVGGSGRLYMSDGNNYNYAFGNFEATTTETTFKQYVVPTQSVIRLYAYNSGSAKAYFKNISVKEALTVSADIDVTRATAATRVDENGLVNYAKILGSDLVTNGDFATNSNWTAVGLGGWTISGGSARCDGTSSASAIYQQNILVVGTSYEITFTAIISQGDVSVSAGFSGTGTARTVSGTYTQILTAATNDELYIKGNNNFIGSISNITAKECTRDNVPRIDYTGGGCPHILAEPQRTNELLVSENFSSSYWSSTGSPTITTNYGISPSGANNSVRIQGNNGVAIYNSGGFASDDSRSIFIKATSGSGNIQLLSHNSNTNNVFSIDTNWKRVELNSSPNVSSLYYAVDMRSASTNIYDVEIWGAQLEEGSFPTSYIPTSGSTVTRNQDVFTRDGISSLINSTEGVFFIEMAALSNSGNYRLITLSDGTTSNRLFIGFRLDTGYIYYFVIVGGSTVASHITSTTSLDFSKVAVKWKANDFALWIDGSEISTHTSGNSFTANTLNTLQMNEGDGSGFEFHGKVKQLQVYKTALTDMQLIQLTGTTGTDFYESYSEMAESLTYTIQ